MIIELKNIEKNYKNGEKTYPVLYDLDFSLEEGEMVAILGKSGSGKSTLLRILGLLELPDAGIYYWKTKDTTKMKKSGISFAIRK